MAPAVLPIPETAVAVVVPQEMPYNHPQTAVPVAVA
jgi:hypothetical protein